MKTSSPQARRPHSLRSVRSALVLACALAVPASAATRSDFNGDRKADVLWRNSVGGRNYLWLMNGASISAQGLLPTVSDRAWRVQSTEDFTGDGKADILWRHADSGENVVWTMNGLQRAGFVSLPPLPDTDWQVAAACDLNGDGVADIFWRHRASGENQAWMMGGGTTTAIVRALPVPDLGWKVVGCADFNGDGKADLLWRHAVTGSNYLWLMNGSAILASGYLPTVADLGWEVAGVGDLTGDGKADIVWRHNTGGWNQLWRMNGLTRTATLAAPRVEDVRWRVALLGDFDGDGKSDVFWRHASSGENLIWFMDGATVRSQARPPAVPDLSWAVSANPPPAAGPTLFLATLVPEAGATTTASGTATVVLAEDEKSARISLDFSGLSSTQTAAHIHGPAAPGQNAPPLFSLPEGTFGDLLWIFAPTAGLSEQDQVTALKTGRLYVNVHSANYPNGEIRGQLVIVPGSAPPPPPPPPPPPGPPTASAALRFLEQSTMGPTPALVSHVHGVGYAGFLEEQFAEPPSTYLDFVQAAAVSVDDTQRVNALRNRLFINALHGTDQLRQRVALALSQILVVSSRTVYDGPGLALYLDVLGRNAFGSYRTLLDEITLNPAMGDYLDMVNNDKPNPARGRTANENYAREVMQLFSIGLYKMYANGSLKLDAASHPIPTYDQPVIENMARVLTGWTYAPQPGATPQAHNPRNYLAPMVLWPANHDTAAKTILDGRVLPAGQTGVQDLKAALDALFLHPNAGPFLGRQLIQHLVTSNPSPGYVARVALAFADNGSGVRGDLKAVIRAVLLDPEARREPTVDFGRHREPILFMTTLLRNLGAAGDGWGLTSYASNMNQNPVSPPTVFSFFEPDYQVPGTTLFGPPLQIYTESTAIRRANFVNSLVFGTIGVPSYAPPGATSVSVDLTPWVNLAANPTALVDDLNARLLGGRMPADMRATLIQAVTNTSSTSPITRAKTAVYLVGTSAQYNVQR